MKTVYIDTQIPPVDQPLKEEFAGNITEDRSQADILVLSKKSVEPGDITRLMSQRPDRRIMFLADAKDAELINEAKAAGVKDIFYSPVKLPPLIDRIEEALSPANSPADAVKQPIPEPAAKPPQPKDDAKKDSNSNTADELSGLLQTIKARMANSGEMQALRSENNELKNKIKMYEDFVAVLKEIFAGGA